MNTISENHYNSIKNKLQPFDLALVNEDDIYCFFSYKYINKVFQEQIAKLDSILFEITRLTKIKSQKFNYNSENYNSDFIEILISGLNDFVKTSLDNKHKQNEISYLINRLNFIDKAFIDINNKYNDLFKSKILIVSGEGGIGKTHRLAKIYKDNEGTIFLVGKLINNDNWQGLINSIRESYDSHSLLILDAFNEIQGIHIREELIKLINSISKNIKIIISHRNGSLDKEIFKSFLLTKYIELEGIADTYESLLVHSRHYGIDITELYDFQSRNPFFMKVFCEVYLDKMDEKDFHRGSIKLTDLFEQYIKARTTKLQKEGCIRFSRDFFWRGIIKPIAEWLYINNSYRINEKEIIKIFKRAGVDNIDEIYLLIETLVNNLIIEKNINKEIEYSMPFQTLSDFLIVRVMFSSYKKGLGEISKDGKALSFIDKYPNILDAVAVYLPERSKGKIECYEVFRDNISPYFLVASLKYSIKYRSPKIGFKKENVNSIIEYIIDNDVANSLDDIFVSCMHIVYNPFNCNLLIKNLDNRNQFYFDSYIYHLSYNYEEEIVNKFKILDHSISEKLNDDKLELIALSTLAFLGTSNRIVRDSASKALCSVLVKRQNLCCNILTYFSSLHLINKDEYVLERVLHCLEVFSHFSSTEVNTIIYDFIKKYADNQTPNIRIKTYLYLIIKNLASNGICSNLPIEFLFSHKKIDFLNYINYDRLIDFKNYGSLYFSLSEQSDFYSYALSRIKYDFEISEDEIDGMFGFIINNILKMDNIDDFLKLEEKQSKFHRNWNRLHDNGNERILKKYQWIYLFHVKGYILGNYGYLNDADDCTTYITEDKIIEFCDFDIDLYTILDTPKKLYNLYHAFVNKFDLIVKKYDAINDDFYSYKNIAFTKNILNVFLDCGYIPLYFSYNFPMGNDISIFVRFLAFLISDDEINEARRNIYKYTMDNTIIHGFRLIDLENGIDFYKDKGSCLVHRYSSNELEYDFSNFDNLSGEKRKKVFYIINDDYLQGLMKNKYNGTYTYGDKIVSIQTPVEVDYHPVSYFAIDSKMKDVFEKQTGRKLILFSYSEKVKKGYSIDSDIDMMFTINGNVVEDVILEKRPAYPVHKIR